MRRPLSAFQGKAVPPQPTANATLSKEVPIGPQPALIAPTGIKIYDEIGRAMVDNPPNPPDPVLGKVSTAAFQENMDRWHQHQALRSILHDNQPSIPGSTYEDNSPSSDWDGWCKRTRILDIILNVLRTKKCT